MTHQITGYQPKALANAVYGAAANIEDMSQIMPVLERIGEKHRSLQIKPEHYPIVGENLLGAIKEVLGANATPEIMDAWADAYEVISDVFIRMEEKMYKTAEIKPGGWAGYKDFRVERKVKESEMSMLNAIVAEQSVRSVTFIQAAMNGKLHAFKDYVHKVAEQNNQVKSYVVYQSPTDDDRAAKNFDHGGYITLDWLKTILNDKEADYYFCGPPPFMKAINKALKEWGVSTDKIHYEFFGSFGDIEQ